MVIQQATKKDLDQVAPLIALFRQEHKLIKGIKSSLDIKQAKIEYLEYLNSNFPIYISINENKEVVGYVVCRLDEDVVWVESIYVIESYRRKGLAGRLYQHAEELASELGGETLYNWVLPNNHKMIKFLSKQGYDVLNMIEIRKAYKNEKLQDSINVGNHQYKY